MTLKPTRLRPGDPIAVIAPAGPVSAAELEPGLNLLKSRGFEILTGAHLHEKRGYLAGEDEARLEDLHRVFDDRRVKAVICARGGYGTLRLLPRLDFEMIRRNPKIFVGYSDITALLSALHEKTGLITFHGPMVREFSSNRGDNLGALLDLLSSERPPDFDLPAGNVLRQGRGRGRLLGGNLSVLTHLVGTPFMPDLNGAVLFLEERGEALYRIDRMVTHLQVSGHMKGLSGLVLGYFVDCGDTAAICDLFLERLSGLAFPVVAAFPAGHGEVNRPLPIGLFSVLDTDRLSLTWEEAPVTA